MPIIRRGLNDYVATARKRLALTERQPDDWDLAFYFEGTEHRIYVLDAHEWFDPQTSSHHSEQGLSRHAMVGPSFIDVYIHHGMWQTQERHVNDPAGWASIRRCIREGYLSADSLCEGPATDELSVQIVPEDNPHTKPKHKETDHAQTQD